MKIVGVNFHKIIGFDNKETATPKDMLCYDTAFISNRHPGIIAFPKFLVSRQGILGGTVTHGKWHSFQILISIKPLNDVEIYQQGLFSQVYVAGAFSNTGDWHTFRHPRTPDGAINSLVLRRYELEAYLNAEDTTEL